MSFRIGRLLNRAEPEWWRWLPALILMAVIFAASDTPGEQLPDFQSWDRIVKKGGHMLGYALLCVAYLYGLEGTRRTSAGRILFAILLTAVYAATDEFHQSFTPGRSATLLDVGLDAAGAVLGGSLWNFLLAFSGRRNLGLAQK